MRCLTVRQPHAWGLISGSKRIENRSRRTRYRGPLAIHAAASRADLTEAVRAQYPGCPGDDDLVFGHVIGIVDLVDCVPVADVAGEPYAEGPWCWLVADPRPIVPVRWRGQLAVFEVPDELLVRA